jgi:hypothetical protein
MGHIAHLSNTGSYKNTFRILIYIYIYTLYIIADLAGMIKQLLYGFEMISIYIVPLDTNYFPRLRLGK